MIAYIDLVFFAVHLWKCVGFSFTKMQINNGDYSCEDCKWVTLKLIKFLTAKSTIMVIMIVIKMY